LFEQRKGNEMTFLEKAKSEREEKRIKFSEDGLPSGCPYKYGYEEDHSCGDVECVECWNREIPGTEPLTEKEKMIDAMSENAYNKGLNDAWELVKRIIGIVDKENHELIPARELTKIYGSNDLLDIFAFTPQEALAKLKAYEEAQNKAVVGDVIKDNYDDKAVVLDETESYYSVFTQSGCVEEWNKAICKKTGKHIDISSILEQIGE